MPRLPQSLSVPLRLLLGAVLTGAVLTGCEASLVATGGEAGVETEIDRLRAQLGRRPAADVQRDLGALYLRAGRVDSAETYLTRAAEQEEGDPKTLFFLGLLREKQGDPEAAMDLLARYESVPDTSRYRSLMRGRYEWLRRRQAESEIQTRVQQEQGMSDAAIESDAVAVFAFSYRGTEPRYAPLGRGLAELVISDLANVEDLTVVERIRLQALKRELELAATDYVDPETAPRVGRLIGAGRLVGGSYDVSGGDRLRLDVTLTDLQSGGAEEPIESGEQRLSQLVDVSSEIVFRLADRLGIALTAEERAAIEEVPTRDLTAFLAFSRALEADDRGNYRRAATLYQQAAQADPSFQAAVRAQKTADALARAGGSVDDALAAAPGGPSPQSLDLTQLRLNNMGVGPRAAPTDNRQPASEATDAETALPDPPDTPDRQTDGGG